MFVALRDIVRAKGRFALMIGVIALLTLLLVLLTGLTRGLAHQNISAISGLPADRIVLAPTLGEDVSWSDSQIDAAQAAAIAAVPGIASEPLSVAQMRIEAGGSVTSLAVLGIEPGGEVARGLAAVPAAGQVVLPADTATDLGVRAGDTVTMNGQDLTVAGTAPVDWYSHSPVGYVVQDTFADLAHQAEGAAGSALLLRGDEAALQAAAATAADTGTRALTVRASLAGLPSYSSENGSLSLIQAFLYGISALVTIAFLSVWTIQRTRDLAVLRALGASSRYVLADTVGQAAVLLGAGVLLGGVLGGGGGAALAAVAPFDVSALTVAGPVVGVLAIGLIGSLAATARVTRIDPLLALGGN
ncbi:ABC transporter permease [Brachybacterium hainanense]|uniref:ABC transporter permease n=1 Tax=Brachybacterium hainanense TaxID=1541174 RepID=A0ABV6RCF8_9MICO